MKVDVQVEPAAEALDDGDAARVAVADTVAVRPPALETQQYASVDREHGTRELVIPREEIAEAVGQAQHPLPHVDARETAVDEPGGALGHAPAAAARAEATPFARERDEPLEGAVAAPKAREAVCRHAARQEIAELLLHEFGQARAVGVLRGGIEERIQMLVHHAVQHAALTVARSILR